MGGESHVLVLTRGNKHGELDLLGSVSHVHLLRRLISEASQCRGPCRPGFILYAQ